MGGLTQILPHHGVVDDAVIWAVYPSTNVVTPKVRAFVDYCVSGFGKNPYWKMVNQVA